VSNLSDRCNGIGDFDLGSDQISASGQPDRLVGNFLTCLPFVRLRLPHFQYAQANSSLHLFGASQVFYQNPEGYTLKREWHRFLLLGGYLFSFLLHFDALFGESLL
jgi:hypothetical protein